MHVCLWMRRDLCARTYVLEMCAIWHARVFVDAGRCVSARTYVLAMCAHMHLYTMHCKHTCIAMIRAKAYALGMLMAVHARVLARAVPTCIAMRA